jgi:hypothetical protein
MSVARIPRIGMLAALFLAGPAAAAAPSAPPATDGWPRTLKTATATYSVYPPQVDSWDGYQI